MSEHGILFKREIREAIAAGRKTQTRRLSGLEEINKDPDSYQFKDWTHDGCASFVRRFRHSHEFEFVKLRYQVGDLLYVKTNYFTTKADAKLRLRVTEVKDPHRIQDISEEDCIKEGWPRDTELFPSMNTGYKAKAWFKKLWDSINAKPKPVKEKGIVTHYASYPWDDIQEIRTYKGKPWHVCGNPWVFGYVFERVER